MGGNFALALIHAVYENAFHIGQIVDAWRLHPRSDERGYNAVFESRFTYIGLGLGRAGVPFLRLWTGSSERPTKSDLFLQPSLALKSSEKTVFTSSDR